MADPELVRRKLARLRTYLDELKQVRPADFQAYVRDVASRRAVERLLQLLVEVANDINVHAIVDAGLPPPDSYYEGFLRIAELDRSERPRYLIRPQSFFTRFAGECRGRTESLFAQGNV